jgi:hypothetical protein
VAGGSAGRKKVSCFYRRASLELLWTSRKETLLFLLRAVHFGGFAAARGPTKDKDGG